MTDEHHPELAGYDPGDERPRSRRAQQHLARIVVIIAIVALVLPGLIVSVATANHTADVACQLAVARNAPDSVAYSPRFEVLGPAGPGWYCYAQSYDGTVVLITALGLIPSVRFVPPGSPT